jgi:N-formylglutamate amidohydrolase
MTSTAEFRSLEHFTMLFRVTLALWIATVSCGAARAYDAASMVIASSGTLPLILTVPHDGDASLGSTPTRKPGGSTQDKFTRDAGTRALAEQIASHLEARLGKRPFIVIAGFSRKYLDANRTQHDAMQSVQALPAYRAYHDQIAAFVTEVRRRFPAGALLVDIHGQADEPDIIFRGTRAGLTTTRLLKHFGATAMRGENSILGVLAAKGYQVHPPISVSALKEDPRFEGGYTVFAYGSHRPQGIDAIQLEFGVRVRKNARLPQDVADALHTFMRRHGMLTTSDGGAPSNAFPRKP